MPHSHNIEPDNPRLGIINDWLRLRLEKPTEAEATASFLTTFIKKGLTELTQQLCGGNSDDVIITVRSSFRKENLYLRPVYSQPEQLRMYFQDLDKQKPFRYPDKDTALLGIDKVERQENHNKPYAFAGLYHINNEPILEDSFRSRINDFHRNLCETNDLRNLATNATTCFFAARNKEKKFPLVELQHILAVYFPRISQTGHQPVDSLDELLAKAEGLFDGLDLISLIDASLFETEGLKLVAELLPEFSRDDFAPADKIAFAVEKLRLLLERNMIGRHGGDKGGEPPRLFYIATSFERQHDPEKCLHPRLEIYPHDYRQEYLEASYFVTHRGLPSATKFLLWRYLKSKKHLIVETTSASKNTERGIKEPPVKCADRFEDMFRGLNTATPVEEWQDLITPHEFPDFLHLTSGTARNNGTDSQTQTPWQALNKPLDPALRSIAAFVVEGRIVDTVDDAPGSGDRISKRCLPRGIFAIESHYEDGFSDADISSLRIVFQGMAALIRLISHQNAPIDYRSLIASTFKEDAELEDRSKPEIFRLIFLVQKLDAFLLRKLLAVCKKCPDPLKVYGLEPGSLCSLEEIAKICEPSDKPDHEERARILKDRLKKLQKLLSPHDDHGREKKAQLLQENVLSFLEACPENFTWASYLACMAQTLGDRIAGTKLPQFTRMLPGFSASGMFITMVDDELRQVVKLSEAKKLKKENNRYRKWVRYRLVNAARIPANGLAFETTGEVGKRCGQNKELKTIIPLTDEEDTTSDGVLVSDLVSGGEKHEVNTLLDLIAINVGRSKDRNPSTSTINKSLKFTFGRNATLWKSVPSPNEWLKEPKTAGWQKSSGDKWKQDPTTAVLVASRIGTNEAKYADKRKRFEQDIARLQSLSATPSVNLSFEKILQVFKSVTPPQLADLQIEHLRICHGDLNSRNLTWAEELQSFFFIDFERVGPNVIGTDQFRLLVSLITELRSGWDSAQDSDDQEAEAELAHMYKELDRGLSYICKVFKRLIGSGSAPNGLDDIAGSEEAKHLDSKLVKTLATILRTATLENLTAPGWRCHWALMLLCFAAKEFTYACRMVEKEHITPLLDGKKFKDIPSLIEVEKLVQDYVADKPGLKNLAGNFIRYFVAARLLLSLIDYMNERAAKVRS